MAQSGSPRASRLGLAAAARRSHTDGMDFASKRCVPCEGGTPRMAPSEVDASLGAVSGWDVREERTRLHKHYRFKDFVTAMRFVSAMAALAEAEGHHPDFAVHYDTVDVTLWTHAVGGLSENDFILAAKLDRLPESGLARA